MEHTPTRQSGLSGASAILQSLVGLGGVLATCAAYLILEDSFIEWKELHAWFPAMRITVVIEGIAVTICAMLLVNAFTRLVKRDRPADTARVLRALRNVFALLCGYGAGFLIAFWAITGLANPGLMIALLALIVGGVAGTVYLTQCARRLE